MSKRLTHKLNNDIIVNTFYNEKIIFFNKLNSLEILPYLPEEIILYILQFLIKPTDYIDYYIEKFYKLKQLKFDLEILPYIIRLNNESNKKEICKNWDYGYEFLLISERHKDGKAFYFMLDMWESFLLDLLMQIKCISKPRSEIVDKKLLEYIMPINKILRTTYVGGMPGTAYMHELELGPYVQKIIDLSITEQNQLFSIWNQLYVDCFKFAIHDHQNGRKEYFSNDPNTSWLCSFVTDFMMCLYH
jgi:hypothetical protein